MITDSLTYIVLGIAVVLTAVVIRMAKNKA